ncbi:MAG: holo-ACP synthase [Betaproteobacteria bacterium]|nr:MAG: holo-ACP synthase [Betaproteobacteria bacterium]
MIYGIGTDIVAVARIQSVLLRHGERFARRILSDDEMEQLGMASAPANWLAKRWAAKEAFAKATGLGMRAPLHFAGIAVHNDALGKPAFKLADEINEWMHRQGITSAHLSVSDERDFALAFVVLET